jgi:hypothetical protein
MEPEQTAIISLYNITSFHQQIEFIFEEVATEVLHLGRVKNEEVLHRVKEERNVLHTVKKKEG